MLIDDAVLQPVVGLEPSEISAHIPPCTARAGLCINFHTDLLSYLHGASEAESADAEPAKTKGGMAGRP